MTFFRGISCNCDRCNGDGPPDVYDDSSFEFTCRMDGCDAPVEDDGDRCPACLQDAADAAREDKCDAEREERWLESQRS